jgi:hypothetical protein
MVSGGGITMGGTTWDQHFKRRLANRLRPSRTLFRHRASTALTITEASIDPIDPRAL